MFPDSFDQYCQRRGPSIASHGRKIITTLTVPTMAYAERQALEMVVIGAWVRK